ncbi:hypothetical protein [Streptomyces sp. NPDC031705]|uniref:hypothetical protein n=1 Tax=Streptomyces sp. NPDC031705 TaxID=3155729 RepID=UPI0033C33C52
MHTFSHARIHAARTAELAAEAAAWRLAREAAPATAALRNQVGEALIAAGIRLMQPAHLQARIRQPAA